MPHQCPKTGCVARVPDDQLACYPHWTALPASVRAAVTQAWARGRGRGSAAHRAAVAHAVAVMNRA